MADIATLAPGETDLPTIVAKINEVIDRINDNTIGNEALAAAGATLAAKVNSATIGNSVLGAKMDEVFEKFSFDSEEPAAETPLEIPEDEIEVTIEAVARTFTFNVAKFKFGPENTEYLAQDIIDDLAGDDDFATDSVTDLVAAGSVIIEGEGSGVLTETTA